MKTAPTRASVTKFLNQLEDPGRRADCRDLTRLMQQVTAAKPVMWGSAMVGFGRYHYKYDSGREGDWFLTGFSPRKQALTIYIMSGFDGHDELMEKLGKFKTGKSCLYVKRLSDLDPRVLTRLITRSVNYLRNNPGS